MKRALVLLRGALSLSLLLAGTATAAAQQQRPATLQVVVVDPTGGVIGGAAIELTRDALRKSATTDGQGAASLADLTPGTWTLTVSSPGFDNFVNQTLALRPGNQRIEVSLQIAGFVDEVVVMRDPEEAATDPRGDTLALTLTEDELASLPDSPEDLRQMLDELAGPGAELEVDGFADGDMPSGDQIQQVRIRRTMFSADGHNQGGSRIEVVTRPGVDRWRSTVRFGFRDDSLNARNAFAPTDTPEQHRRVSANFQGPLVKNRSSISLSVENLSSFESPTIRAADRSGLITGVIRRPDDQRNVTIRLEHGLSPTHNARIEYHDRRGEQENLGVGDFDLPERAYSRTNTDRLVRLGSTGTFARRIFNELRVQASWDETSNAALSDAGTVRVLDSKTTGGANIKGGRTERLLQITEKMEFKWGSHSISAGGRFDRFAFDSNEIRNASGTFTFSNTADFDWGLPLSFTQRRGDPTVRYSMFQGAWFVQDDIRVRRNFTLGVGLRHEWQSQIANAWNLSPRLGFSWSPGKGGRTTIRGGAGVFYDWYGASTYEETLQVDGVRVEELTIENPAFPDPFLGANVIVLPNGRVQAAESLELPTIRRATLATERRLGALRVNASYTFLSGTDLLRGRNVNAPDSDGVRPNQDVGNVIEIRSIGQSREHELSLGLSGRVPWHGLFLSGRYEWGNERNDGDGATSLPASNLAPHEWGPARGDVRHRFTTLVQVDLPGKLQAGLNLLAQSAPAYNITTGRDDNGDTVFNDRPEGVTRNSARGDDVFRLDGRMTWRITAGQRRASASAQGQGQGQGGRRGNARPQPRVTGEIYARVTNLLNTVNRTGFSGVRTSSFFGLPRSAQAARRIEVGTRVSF